MEQLQHLPPATGSTASQISSSQISFFLNRFLFSWHASSATCLRQITSSDAHVGLSKRRTNQSYSPKARVSARRGSELSLSPAWFPSQKRVYLMEITRAVVVISLRYGLLMNNNNNNKKNKEEAGGTKWEENFSSLSIQFILLKTETLFKKKKNPYGFFKAKAIRKEMRRWNT